MGGKRNSWIYNRLYPTFALALWYVSPILCQKLVFAVTSALYVTANGSKLLFDSEVVVRQDDPEFNICKGLECFLVSIPYKETLIALIKAKVL